MRFAFAMAVAIASVAAAALIVGCRAVLGIEELDVASDAGGGEGGADAATDALGIPASLGAEVLAEAGPPGSECKTAGNCKMCCRDNVQLRAQFAELQKKANTAMCICAAPANVCSTECAGAGCPPMGGGDPMRCGTCVDTTFETAPLSAQCQVAASACGGDPSCRDALACLNSCR